MHSLCVLTNALAFSFCTHCALLEAPVPVGLNSVFSMADQEGCWNTFAPGQPPPIPGVYAFNHDSLTNTPKLFPHFPFPGGRDGSLPRKCYPTVAILPLTLACAPGFESNCAARWQHLQAGRLDMVFLHTACPGSDFSSEVVFTSLLSYLLRHLGSHCNKHVLNNIIPFCFFFF